MSKPPAAIRVWFFPDHDADSDGLGLPIGNEPTSDGAVELRYVLEEPWVKVGDGGAPLENAVCDVALADGSVMTDAVYDEACGWVLFTMHIPIFGTVTHYRPYRLPTHPEQK